jgi:hypothetical protein
MDQSEVMHNPRADFLSSDLSHETSYKNPGDLELPPPRFALR